MALRPIHIVGIVLAVLLGAVLLLFLTDYGVEATITEKGRDDQGSFIIATTKIGGLEQKKYLPFEQWLLVGEGYFVIYHIASGAVEVYQSEGGSLVYRS